MSATLIEFAQPLLDELSTADDIEMLRRVMTIATLVWNLPVYERRNAPEAPACRAAFEDAMAQAPRPIAKHLDAMARARLTMYAHDPRLAFVEVADQGNGRANIQATAVVFPHGG
jgi:hypothetical protein